MPEMQAPAKNTTEFHVQSLLTGETAVLHDEDLVWMEMSANFGPCKVTDQNNKVLPEFA